MDYMEKAKGKFPDLWKEYGSIFYENKNMKIIYMARDALKDSGKQYMDIVIWLSNNGPDEVKADNLKELAQLKALSGDPAGTLVYTNQLRKMGESGDWMIRLEALAYYLSKQNAMAFATLKNIKSLNQKDIDMIRETFIADKDLHKSILYYEDVIEKKGGKIADYMKLADVYYFDLKNNEKAIQYYKLALKTEPDNGWVSYMIAILSNNIEDAKKIYEKIKVQNTVYGKLAGTILQQHITAKKVSEVQ
jgi:tetratricopeptide (TPR) repeat protein